MSLWEDLNEMLAVRGIPTARGKLAQWFPDQALELVRPGVGPASTSYYKMRIIIIMPTPWTNETNVFMTYVQHICNSLSNTVGVVGMAVV